MKVALKIEKPDKSKRILLFEYDVLKQLQGLNHTPQVYEFVDRKSSGQNFIVMRLLGKNLANQKKVLGRKMTLDLATNYLVILQSLIFDSFQLQMIDAIEEVHNRGFIHRDIKPSNFVIGKGIEKPKVYIVDFGLAKQHMQHGVPLSMRPIADFRGTITYASLNAHHKIDLARRDDMWSYYFVILDFLNEILPWRNNSVKDEVKDIKLKCFSNPEKYLWTTTTRGLQQVKDIFYHLKNLEYADSPNYQFIRDKLIEIKNIQTTQFIHSSVPQYVYHPPQIQQIQQPSYVIQTQNPIYEKPYSLAYNQHHRPQSKKPAYQAFANKQLCDIQDNQNMLPFNRGQNIFEVDVHNDPLNMPAYQPIYQPQTIIYQPQSFEIRKPKYIIQQSSKQNYQPQQQQHYINMNQHNQSQVFQPYSSQLQPNQTYQIVKPQTNQISFDPAEIFEIQGQPKYQNQSSHYLNKNFFEIPQNNHSLQLDLADRCCSPFLANSAANKDRKASNDSFNERLFEHNCNIMDSNTQSSGSSNNQFNPFQHPPYSAFNPVQTCFSNFQGDLIQDIPTQVQYIDNISNQQYIQEPKEIMVQPQPVYIQVQQSPQIFLQPVQTQVQQVTKFQPTNTYIIQQQQNPHPYITQMKKRDQKFMDKFADPRKQQYDLVKRELLNQQYHQKKMQNNLEPIVHLDSIIACPQLV
eukprot:403338552